MAARLHQDFKLMKEQGRFNPRPNSYQPSGQQQQVHHTTANLMSKKVLISHLHHIWSGILLVVLEETLTPYMLVALLDGQAKDTLLPTIQPYLLSQCMVNLIKVQSLTKEVIDSINYYSGWESC